MGRKLYLRKPYNLSPYLLGLAYRAPIRRLQVTYSTLLPYFLTSLGTTTAVIAYRRASIANFYSTPIELLGGTYCLLLRLLFLFPLRLRTSLVYFS